MGRTPSLRDQIDGLGDEIEHLVGSLSEEELLAVTTEAVREHRKFLDAAEHAFAKLEAAKARPGQDSAELSALEATYLEAMKRNNAQMMLVASLTERLGYIPNVDPEPAN